MDRILDMISQWNPLGQGIFFLIILGSLYTLISLLIKLPAIMKHGWPPANSPQAVETEEEE